MEKVFYSTKKIIKRFAQGGNMLIVATVLALLIANLPVLGELYAELWKLPVSLEVGGFNIFNHHGEPMSLMQFINDALMVIFFFTVGLEIKREVLVGELASVRKALLPIIAACGGMIVPVIIFFAIGYGCDYVNGCAIPMATDIAFSLGVLAMLGSRVPISLKVFLTTLAVVDDIGGIMVIAIFYSTDINYMMLLYSLAVIALLLIGANMWKIKSKLFYIGLGFVVWYLFLNSGIHSTIAGVIVAFCVPATPRFAPAKYIATMRDRLSKFSDKEDVRLTDSHFLSKEQIDWLKEMKTATDKVISPLQDLEDSLQPLVNYIIIPLFAFANAGVIFEGMSLSAIYSGVGLAVICGLVIGKFVGVFTFSWVSIKIGLAPRPTGSNWKMLAGVSMLAGIGFTVSLFIATLSYNTAEFATILNDAKLGILIGSLLSGILGYFYLSKVLPNKR
ncbi:MAG: Na+/H+ antiporter NhaA [Bacteroidales bacterium]|nr:Na+/H+ antiporter NhaA [Bacteroidales bacterium]